METLPSIQDIRIIQRQFDSVTAQKYPDALKTGNFCHAAAKRFVSLPSMSGQTQDRARLRMAGP